MSESIEEKLNRGEHVLIKDALHIPRVAEFMADIESGKISMCGCLGPQYGEPYCPCQMTQRGLPSPEKRIAAQRRDAINNAKSALPGGEWHKFVNGNLKK